MSTDQRQLLCWKCGADLKTVPRPFSRFAECPDCKSELHVCRMCRHYDLRYVGQCNHDFADKVLVKEKSNFCGHFKPDPGAYRGAGDSEKAKAQQELHTLFGKEGAPGEREDDSEPASEADEAKRKLNDLFGDQ